MAFVCRENGSLGMQCDKIADFSEGTDAKSANLPKNPQSLHSHTAMTNFFVCVGSPTESTPSETKPSAECKADSESKESLESSLTESRADSESSSESKQLTQSTTSKNLIKALPNINSACVSTSRAQLQNCAIFAEQKSNQYVGAIAPTTPRPLRGVQSLEKGGRSASATIALEADIARHSPRLPKRKSGALFFSGLGRAGRGETPFLFAQTRDSKKN